MGLQQVIAIDPGPTVSGWSCYSGADIGAGVDENETVLAILHANGPSALVLERVQNYGRILGKSTFDTIYWTGRFAQAGYAHGHTVQRMYFADVRQHFCGRRSKVKERDVWLQIVERYGGAARAVGTRKAPGSIAHVKGHARSALALALTWWDRRQAVDVDGQDTTPMALCDHANEVPYTVQRGHCVCPPTCGCRATMCSPVREHQKRMSLDVTPY